MGCGSTLSCGVGWYRGLKDTGFHLIPMYHFGRATSLRLDSIHRHVWMVLCDDKIGVWFPLVLDLIPATWFMVPQQNSVSRPDKCATCPPIIQPFASLGGILRRCPCCIRRHLQSLMMI